MKVLLKAFLVATIVAMSCIGCNVGDPQDPMARFEVEISDRHRSTFLQQMESFANANGFSFEASDSLSRDDRKVWRVRLERGDGTMINADNFMDSNTMVVFFYSKHPEAAWRLARDSWQDQMQTHLGDSAKVVETAVGSSE